MDKFVIGDTVQLISPRRDNSKLRVGDVGIVVDLSKSGSVGVDWGRDINGHHCDGTCEDGRGWYVSPFEVSRPLDFSGFDMLLEYLFPAEVNESAI